MSNCHLKEASVEQTTTIGLDIAKHVFRAHGADAAGRVLLRKRLTRAKLLGFLATQTPCAVAMEACAGSHYWAREISKLGHTVRLIPPAYVKPFVKRQKSDAADAEAICEAAQRPSMRFVPIKDEEQQANGVVFRGTSGSGRERSHARARKRPCVSVGGCDPFATSAHVTIALMRRPVQSQEPAGYRSCSPRSVSRIRFSRRSARPA